MPTITHPSKEQVRAYMIQRERACLPPPSPDEVRRQLGWRLGDDDPLIVHLCVLLPATVGQLAALIAIDWFFTPTRFAVRQGWTDSIQ
jgi:hypothetical protein